MRGYFSICSEADYRMRLGLLKGPSGEMGCACYHIASPQRTEIHRLIGWGINSISRAWSLPEVNRSMLTVLLK